MYSIRPRAINRMTLKDVAWRQPVLVPNSNPSTNYSTCRYGARRAQSVVRHLVPACPRQTPSVCRSVRQKGTESATQQPGAIGIPFSINRTRTDCLVVPDRRWRLYRPRL